MEASYIFEIVFIISTYKKILEKETTLFYELHFIKKIQ